LIGRMAGNETNILNQVAHRAGRQATNTGRCGCWRNYEVAEHASIRRAAGVMMHYDTQRGSQHQHDQKDRNE
jgi:hypothetical protein